MHRVFLLTGSNRGSRSENLDKANFMIAQSAGEITGLSGVHESEPWGFHDEIPFLNQALEVKTDLAPAELLRHLLRIERSLGRVRVSPGYHSRIIDIDILMYDDLVHSSPELVIPHPHLAARRFVLIPLAEIAAEIFHPVCHQTIAELLVNCGDHSKVVPWHRDRPDGMMDITEPDGLQI